MKIKEFFKNCFLTRWMYLVYRRIKYRNLEEIKENMKAKGNETVFFIENTLSGKAFFYFDMGTMLGIVREGRLLGHDLDIDVAVYTSSEDEKDRVRNILLDTGCKLRYSYYVKELGVVEDSFEINGLKFDVNYYVRESDKDVCYLMYRDNEKSYEENEMDVVKLSVSAINEVKKVDFFGKQVTVPKEAELYLAERYGDNWRIPNKNYVYWQGPSTNKTNYIGFQRKGE